MVDKTGIQFTSIQFIIISVWCLSNTQNYCTGVKKTHNTRRFQFLWCGQYICLVIIIIILMSIIQCKFYKNSFFRCWYYHPCIYSRMMMMMRRLSKAKAWQLAMCNSFCCCLSVFQFNIKSQPYFYHHPVNPAVSSCCTYNADYASSKEEEKSVDSDIVSFSRFFSGPWWCGGVPVVVCG